MKNFYEIPETKEQALANLDEMNEIKSTRRDGKFLKMDIQKYGLIERVASKYQEVVLNWLHSVTVIEDVDSKAAHQERVAEILRGWGYTVEYRNEDQPAFRTLVIK